MKNTATKSAHRKSAKRYGQLIEEKASVKRPT